MKSSWVVSLEEDNKQLSAQTAPELMGGDAIEHPVESTACFKFGDRKHLPPDRAPLHRITSENGTPIGEGTLVQYVAFISEARHSNVSSGESVNCTRRGAPKNDIHLDLNASLDEEQCQSVSAEMSPHFRPD